MGDLEHQCKKPKRQDLQGIRGLAIIAVLGFHFYPSLFPNGYLGVDQFFVLSGFLMCMLLKRSESLPTCSLITLFYSKRFKRILPLYLLIITFSMVFLYFCFPETAIENNQSSATKALLFVSNRPKTDQEDYFQQLAIGIDIFTHTWSLSVEIQFYFLVPIFFIIGNRFSNNFQYAFYSLIGCLSLVYYIFSNSNVAFNSVFARIWQFIIGMIVYLASIDKNDETSPVKKKYQLLENQEEFDEEQEERLLEVQPEPIGMADNDSKQVLVTALIRYLMLITLVSIMCCPIILPVIVRPVVTIFTGLLIFTSGGDRILSNKILTYIGDISYSLYLIHWPIYGFWKLTRNNNQAELFALLLLSIVFAIVMFETFEKWYLNISSTGIGLLVIVLFILNVALINKDIIHFSIHPTSSPRLDGLTDDMTMDDALRLNVKWTQEDNKNLMVPTCEYINSEGPLGQCEQKGLDKNGKLKLAIIGNSWTANHGNMFYQECHKKANRIVQESAYGCEVFYGSDHSERCDNYVKKFEKRIADLKPDYVFTVVRFFTTGDPLFGNAASLDNDEIYQFMKKQVKRMTAHIKEKLYILKPVPWIFGGKVGDIVPRLKKGDSPKDIDKDFVDFTNYEMATKRFNQLFKDCGEKCVPIDYGKVFFNQTTSTWRFYDERGFSYFTGINHVSPRGLEQVRHIYTDICKKL